MQSPLHFTPLFQDYLWGGKRLYEQLSKEVPPPHQAAESWEIVDHAQGQSIVTTGEFTGQTLSELVQKYPAQLFGKGKNFASFPLLFKILDAQKALSLQVHPNDEQARRQSPPDLGKTEAWYVLDAKPDSKIYAGLKEGATPQSIRKAIDQGELEEHLHQFTPKIGDCIFIPAGTCHAIGAGLLIAEIQQASNTTFRLFDWNRRGPDGKPRPLHIDQGLAVLDFQKGPVNPQVPFFKQENRQRLVECDKFIFDRLDLTVPYTLANDEAFHLLYVAEGSLEISDDQRKRPLQKGETALLPASQTDRTLTPVGSSALLLDVFLP
ncbi:MAG: class I mannose-6-phosphate isomerase [Pirellulaceae bacterium]|nr:class I mannose-6-phosphate isomerase [Pirellulaceae bacterium]